MPLRTKKKKTITFNKRSKKLVGGALSTNSIRFTPGKSINNFTPGQSIINFTPDWLTKKLSEEKAAAEKAVAEKAVADKKKYKKETREKAASAAKEEENQKLKEKEAKNKAEHAEKEKQQKREKQYEVLKKKFFTKLSLLTKFLDKNKNKSAYVIKDNLNSSCTHMCGKDTLIGGKRNYTKPQKLFYDKQKNRRNELSKKQNIKIYNIEMFIEKLNIYLDHYFNDELSKPMYKLELDIAELMRTFSKSFEKLCGYITNYILFLYFHKFYEKYVTEVNKKAIRSVDIGSNYFKLCFNIGTSQEECKDKEWLFNMLYLQIPNMLEININLTQKQKKKIKINKPPDFWKRLIYKPSFYDPDTINKLYEATLQVLQHHIKINSTEEWATAWYNQQKNQDDRTLDEFKKNQLDTLFTKQYEIVYGLPLPQEKKKELQQIQDNITNYHNINAISILNHLLIFSTDEVSCKQRDVSELEGEYFNLINVCN